MVKTKNKIRKFGILGVSILLLSLLLLVIGCAGEPDVVPTIPEAKKPIVVSISKDLTGPVSSTQRYAYMAQTDYIEWLNEQGGIDGHEIEYVWADSQFSPATVLSNWPKFVDAGTVLHFTCGTMEDATLRKQVDKLVIPLISLNMSAPLLFPEPSYTYAQGNYLEWTATMVKWVTDKWKADGKEGRPQIGFIGYQISSSTTVTEGLPLLEDELGFDFGPVEFTPMPITDVKVQVKRLDDAGCDYAIIFAMAGQPAIVLKDAADMNVDVKFMAITPEKATAKLAPDLASGLAMFSSYAIWTEDDVPAIKLMKELQLKYHGEVVEEDQYSSGWLGAVVGFEAIRIALQDVGIDNLDGPAVQAAMHKIRDLDTGGLTLPISITHPNEREFSYSGKMVAVEEGEFVTVSDWITPPHVCGYEGKLIQLPYPAE